MPSYSSLNVSHKKPNEFTIIFNKQEIHIKNDISSSDIVDLLQITLQKSIDSNGLINPYKETVFLALNIIYLFTDIEFNEEDRQDEFALYDDLINSGLVDMILDRISDEVIGNIEELLDEYSKRMREYSVSAAGMVHSIITDLPKNAMTAKEILEDFDPDKFKEVVDFAQAANGGRSIR